MSKRSYRRLAVVAGAALAVGSMAPAMAAQVAANGTGSATVDLSDVTLPATGTLVLSASALIHDAEEFALESVLGGAQVLADATVNGLQNDVDDVDGIVGAASRLSVNANANANASSGGAAVQVSGVATGGSGLLGVVPGPGALSGASLTPVVGFGRSTATGALGLVDSAQGVVANRAVGLLGTGLNLVNSASITGNASVLASLMGSL